MLPCRTCYNFGNISRKLKISETKHKMLEPTLPFWPPPKTPSVQCAKTQKIHTQNAKHPHARSASAECKRDRQREIEKENNLFPAPQKRTTDRESSLQCCYNLSCTCIRCALVHPSSAHTFSHRRHMDSNSKLSRWPCTISSALPFLHLSSCSAFGSFDIARRNRELSWRFCSSLTPSSPTFGERMRALHSEWSVTIVRFSSRHSQSKITPEKSATLKSSFSRSIGQQNRGRPRVGDVTLRAEHVGERSVGPAHRECVAKPHERCRWANSSWEAARRYLFAPLPAPARERKERCEKQTKANSPPSSGTVRTGGGSWSAGGRLRSRSLRPRSRRSWLSL